MGDNIFSPDYGVLLAMDVHDADGVRAMAEAGEELDGVVGYKLGGLYRVMVTGLFRAAEEMRKYTTKPLIFDQQKYVPCYDYAEPTTERMVQDQEQFADMNRDAGVDGAIFLPVFSYIDSYPQTVLTEKLFDRGVEPFVVGRMTTRDWLVSEGGGVPDGTPELIYERAAREGIEYFVMPGNMPHDVERFAGIVLDNMPSGKTPRILLPGHGTQGGAIREAFKATGGLPSYAVIGPVDCIDARDKESIKETLRSYCDEALGFM